MEYLRRAIRFNAVVAAVSKRKETLGPALSTYIVCEALAGLHYAHELSDYGGQPLGIVHRDVSPHNIFVTYEGEVKVVDFGVAKASTNVSKTEEGGVKGKIAYMAPEQARGGEVDRRVDIFASGLVLWELLASKRMLVGDTSANILQKLLNESLPRLRFASPATPEALEAVVMRALAKEPKGRFQTADEMREAIRPFARGVDRGDLGRKMRELFEHERSEVQRQIRLATDDAQTVTTHEPIAFGLPEIRAHAITSSSPSGASSPSAQSASSPSVTPAPKTTSIGGEALAVPRRQSRTALALGGVIAALLLAVIVLARHPAGTPTNATLTPAASTPMAPSGAAALAAQASASSESTASAEASAPSDAAGLPMASASAAAAPQPAPAKPRSPTTRPTATRPEPRDTIKLSR